METKFLLGESQIPTHWYNMFNLSGHGHMDMSAYDDYLAGKLEDFEYPADKIKESLAHLPKVSI